MLLSTVNRKYPKKWKVIYAYGIRSSYGWESNFQEMMKITFLVFFNVFVKAILLWEHFFDFHVFLTFALQNQHKIQVFFEKVNRITHTLGKSFPKSCCFCVNILCFSCFLSVHKCLQSCMFCEKIGNPPTESIWKYFKFCVSSGNIRNHPYRQHLQILRVCVSWGNTPNRQHSKILH